VVKWAWFTKQRTATLNRFADAPGAILAWKDDLCLYRTRSSGILIPAPVFHERPS